MEFSGFRDITQIGEGGLGRVYRAVRISTGGVVAIKELRDLEYASPAISRARRELDAMLRLKGHPHVVNVEEILDGPNGPLLVMEFAANGTVHDRFTRFGETLPEHEVVIVGLHVADGLAAAHTYGIVHRDVKPQNLLVGQFGQVKVCDFGIAVVVTPDARTATRAYTLDYASPEQIDGGDVGSPSDVYSFAATLLHLLSGHRLTFRERMDLGTRDWGRIAPRLLPLLDPIRHALQVDPDDRPTMADMLAAFESSADDIGLRHRALDPTAQTPPAAPVPRPPTMRATAARPVATPPPPPPPPPQPAHSPVQVSAPAAAVAQQQVPQPQAAQPTAAQPTAISGGRSGSNVPSVPGVHADRRRPVFWWVALVAVLAALAGGIGFAISQGGETDDGTPNVSAAPDGGTTDPADDRLSPDDSVVPVAAVVPPAIALAPKALSPATITANCVAPNGAEANNTPVGFTPVNLTDGVTASAWRCPVAQANPRIYVSFAEPTVVGSVGVIGGYTKIDPTSGVDRYMENYRPKVVRWYFDDGQVVTQDLADDTRTPQIIDVAVTTTRVTLEIVEVYEPDFPPGNFQRREFVAVSEVLFGEP